MHAVHNARIQLLATLLNTMAGTCFTVGIAAPIAAVFFYDAASLPLRAVVAGVLFWFLIAAWSGTASARGPAVPSWQALASS